VRFIEDIDKEAIMERVEESLRGLELRIEGTLRQESAL